jgi:hypothetical protein
VGSTVFLTDLIGAAGKRWRVARVLAFIQRVCSFSA